MKLKNVGVINIVFKDKTIRPSLICSPGGDVKDKSLENVFSTSKCKKTNGPCKKYIMYVVISCIVAEM